MAVRSWLTILLGAIIAGLFAEFFGFVPGSKVFNIYTIVYGGSIIYAAWEDHRDDKQGTIFFYDFRRSWYFAWNFSIFWFQAFIT